MAESEEQLKSLLMKVKEESENTGLKFNIQKTKIMAFGSHNFMANRRRNDGNCNRLYFLGLQNHHRWWLQPRNQKTLAPWKKSYNQPRQRIKKQRHYFANKGLSGQSHGFSSSHVWSESELKYKESWALKNWCFWTVVLEKTLESPLDCKEIKPVNPKGNLSWIFIGRIDAEADAPILWPPDAKSWLIWKRPRCWERLRSGGEGDDRGWDGWMASPSPTQWTWVWASSRSWWWTGKPGVLQSMGSQKPDTTEWLNRTNVYLWNSWY